MAASIDWLLIGLPLSSSVLLDKFWRSFESEPGRSCEQLEMETSADPDIIDTIRMAPIRIANV